MHPKETIVGRRWMIELLEIMFSIRSHSGRSDTFLAEKMLRRPPSTKALGTASITGFSPLHARPKSARLHKLLEYQNHLSRLARDEHLSDTLGGADQNFQPPTSHLTRALPDTCGQQSQGTFFLGPPISRPLSLSLAGSSSSLVSPLFSTPFHILPMLTHVCIDGRSKDESNRIATEPFSNLILLVVSCATWHTTVAPTLRR